MIDSAMHKGIKVCLEEQATFITNYDDKIVRKLLHRITVFDDHFEIYFKSGATIYIHK